MAGDMKNDKGVCTCLSIGLVANVALSVEKYMEQDLDLLINAYLSDHWTTIIYSDTTG